MTSAIELMEEINLNQGEEKTKKIKEDLDQVLLTEQGLDQIKENLDKMVDAMAQHPSYFSRAADFWGELPLWQKIVAGVVLIIPTLVIGIVAQSAILLAISIFSLIAFTTTNFLLDNHNSHNINRTEHLKKGLNGLANTLGVIILSLDKLREQLSSEIEQFQLENEKLTINVQDLGEEIQELALQIKLIQETEKALRQTNAGLEQVSTTLKKSIEEQTRLLEQNEIQLKKAQSNYEQAEFNLSEKIGELKQVKEQMGLQITNLVNLTDVLQGSIKTFSEQLKLDSEQQKIFNEKLDYFLKDKEQSFHVIAKRICNAEEQLSALKDQYEKLNIQYQQLLNRGEKQIERLEGIHLGQQAKHAKTLKQVGLYAVDTKPTSEQEISLNDSVLKEQGGLTAIR